MNDLRIRLDNIIANNDMHIALTDDVDMLGTIRNRTIDELEDLIKELLTNVAEYETSKGQ